MSIDFLVHCCGHCKYWSFPQWETDGFGTCTISKLDNIKICGSEQAWLSTHETNLCIKFESKK